jgi:serine kinase of HPr protein (carbohydrate metabolism regulator)
VIVHATLIVRFMEGRWRGALLRGPSGSGKSDLALRAVAKDWRLVADDRVKLWISGGQLYGRPPAQLNGLFEVRGLGVVAEPALRFSTISLVVDVCDAPDRMPVPQATVLLGTSVPALRLPLREPSSLAKLERALATMLRRRL